MKERDIEREEQKNCKKGEVQMTSRFHNLYQQQVDWADSVFKRTSPHGPLNHLREEADELVESPYDESEYADILLLLFDAWDKTGRSPDQLLDAVENKIKINQARKWQAPDENGVFRHVK